MKESRSETPYFPQELHEQPRAIVESIDATASERADLASRASELDRVIVVGSGDSVFLGEAAVPAFEEMCGVPAEAIEAYDFVVSRSSVVGPRTLVVGISASGKAVRTKQALEISSGAGAVTVSLTNTPESPLSEAAETSLTTEGGISYTFPTKTTTSALAVMIALAADMGLSRERLSEREHESTICELKVRVPEEISSRLEYDEDVKAAAAEMLKREHYVFVGSGACRASALVGAAKICETANDPAVAVNAEEFLHLTGFSTGPKHAVVVVASETTSERELQVAGYAEKQGAAVIPVGGPADEWPPSCLKIDSPGEGLSPWSAALVAMVPLHMFAAEFSSLRGRNPDRPENVDVAYVLDLLYDSSLPGW